MTDKNDGDLVFKLASAMCMKILPVCVYGSEEKPDGGVHTSTISDCVAESIFRMAAGDRPFPLYASIEEGLSFCRCMGGPSWFGYTGFHPDLVYAMSIGSSDPGCAPKLLKASPDVARKTYEAAGTIRHIGQYTVMRRCDDPGLIGQDVKCVIIFGTAGRIRDMCGLAHFRNPGVLNAVEMPWGPSCATLVTYRSSPK